MYFCDTVNIGTQEIQKIFLHGSSRVNVIKIETYNMFDITKLEPIPFWVWMVDQRPVRREGLCPLKDKLRTTRKTGNWQISELRVHQTNEEHGMPFTNSCCALYNQGWMQHGEDGILKPHIERCKVHNCNYLISNVSIIVTISCWPPTLAISCSRQKFSDTTQ